MGAAAKKKRPIAGATELRAKSIDDCIASLNKVRSIGQQDNVTPKEAAAVIEDACRMQEGVCQSLDELRQDQLKDSGPVQMPGQSNAPATEEELAQPASQSRAARGFTWPDSKKILKSALGLLILAYIGWQPVQRLFQVSSVEAVVNSHLITLRSPIEGTIAEQLANLSVGEDVAGRTTLFTIENPRSEYPRADDLRRRIGAISDELLVDGKRLVETQALFAQMSSIAGEFRDARIEQLQATIAAQRSEIAASRAKLVQLNARLKRQVALFLTNVVPQAKIDEVQRDQRVASLEVTTLERRIKIAQIELKALRSDMFVGDDYNDMPYSAQQSYILGQKVTDLKARILSNERLIARLRAEFIDQEKRALQLARADIVLPRRSRVWEVLTAQGEQVTRGQELIRLVDCSLPVVTAAVTETVYNSLSIGAPASFRYRQTGEELPGTVVQLTGVASATANLAIQPNALTKESYRVMVKVPGLANKANCAIGQTGRVVFSGSDKVTRTASAP